MPLTQEQFQKAIDAGFTTDEIIEFEKRRTTEVRGIIPSGPTLKTGEILSPASYREKKAATRGAAFDWLGAIIKSEEEQAATGRADPFGSFKRGVQIPLAGISGVYRAGEGLLSDIALGITEKPKTETFGRHLAETFTGQRTAKFSDVAESLGIREGMPSKTAGLIGMFGLSDIMTGGQLSKAVFIGGKKVVLTIRGGMNKVIEATKDGFKTLKGLKLPTTARTEKNILLETISGQKRQLQLGEQATKARYNLNKILDEARRKGATEADLINIKQTVVRQAEEKTRYELTQLKDTTKQIFEQNKKVLENKFQDLTEKKVLDVQKSLPEYFGSVFKTYDTTLDDVGNHLVLKRGHITLQEANNILRQTVEESIDDEKNFGAAFNKIEKLWSGKYAASSTNLNNPIKLQDLKNDMDSVFKMVNYGKYGRSEDMSAHVLRKHWGKFITDATVDEYGISEYTEMQKWYSQNVDAMKLADKIFKPKKGVLFSEKGTTFLQKFGMAEKPPQAQRELISAIEQGSKKVKGIGGITQEITDLGTEIRNLEEAYQITQANISGKISQSSMEMGKIQYELAQELKQVKAGSDLMTQGIAQRLDNLNLRSTLVRNSVEKEMQERVNELRIILMDRKKAVALARMLGLGIAGAVGVYTAGRAAANIAGFRESYGE